MSTRSALLGIATLLIVAGLVMRLGRWGLPLAVHHSGGGFLWGGMVYALVAAVRPTRWRWRACLLLAVIVIAAVETFRLVHWPSLDTFRATLAGQLLLGRVFAATNMVVDGLGAASIAIVTKRLLWREVREYPRRSTHDPRCHNGTSRLSREQSVSKKY